MTLPRLDTWDDVAAYLRGLRQRRGQPPFRELVREIRDLRVRRGLSVADAPGLTTVHNCFKDGRRRLDVDLLTDLGTVLGLNSTQVREWESACFAVQNQVASSRVVAVSEQAHRAAHFVGRKAQLNEVGAHPELWSISGLAGIGKTQFALRVADGWVSTGVASRVLIADLRGYHDDRAPADGDAMRSELLAVLCGATVADPAAARARLADELRASRSILLLDDAASATQVSAIVDQVSTPVVVTSRQQLALPGAHSLALGALDLDESLEVLATHASPALIGADPESAQRIAAGLGGHPLALNMTARRIVGTKDWSLSDHDAALAEQARLLRLPDGVDAAFALSYQRLSAPAQRLLRLAALQPGSDYAATSLARLVDAGDVGAELDELLAASLLVRIEDRYEMHDLTRTFATATAVTEDAPTVRDSARFRLLDYYLRTAAEAVVATGETPRLGEKFFPVPDTTWDGAEAAQWLRAERENLLSLADPRMCHPIPDYPLQLSRILVRSLDISGRSRDAANLHELALEYARRSGDRVGEAQAEVALALALNPYSPEEARTHAERALTLVDRNTDPDTEATARVSLGVIAFRAGENAVAEAETRAALDIVLNHCTNRRSAGLIGNLAAILLQQGDVTGAIEQHRAARIAAIAEDDQPTVAIATCNLSSCFYELGDYPAAIEAAREAIDIATEIGSRIAIHPARVNLGVSLGKLGETEEARQTLELVLGEVREDNFPYYESGVHVALGDIHLAEGHEELALAAYQTGGQMAEELGFPLYLGKYHLGMGDLRSAQNDLRSAREHYQQAVAILEEMGGSDVGEAQAKLAETEAKALPSSSA